MAFMMPVMKNDYNIYASRSRTTSSSSSSGGGRRRHTQSESAPTSLSCSPGSDVEERLAAVSLGCSPRRGSGHRLATEAAVSKSASSSSLTRFHSKVVEKMRRKLRTTSTSSSSSTAPAKDSETSS